MSNGTILTPPIVLTQSGQQVVADIQGFDQYGQPWTGDMPNPTFSGDNDAAATCSIDGVVTAVADGVANITGSLTTAEGTTLTDTEPVTVTIQQAPPVLSTIKVVFGNPVINPVKGKGGKK